MKDSALLEFVLPAGRVCFERVSVSRLTSRSEFFKSYFQYSNGARGPEQSLKYSLELNFIKPDFLNQLMGFLLHDEDLCLNEDNVVQALILGDMWCMSDVLVIVSGFLRQYLVDVIPARRKKSSVDLKSTIHKILQVCPMLFSEGR